MQQTVTVLTGAVNFNSSFIIDSGCVLGRSTSKTSSDNKRKRVETANDVVKTKSTGRDSKKMKMDVSKNVNLNLARTETIKISDTDRIETYFDAFVKTRPLYVVNLFSKPSFDAEHNRFDSEMKLILRRYIKKYGRNAPVVGCVAWMSDEYIINELSACDGVAIIVNREEYDSWGNGCVKRRYPKLKKMPKPMHVMFKHLGGVMLNVDTHVKTGSSSLYPVRAFGNDSNSRKPHKRRNAETEDGFGGLEHCKYVIFFVRGSKIRQKYEKNGRDILYELSSNKKFKYVISHWDDDALYPFMVWTGSMNFTGNAKNNHDNAQMHVGLDVGLSFYYDFSVTYITSTPVFAKVKTSTPTLNVTSRVMQ